MTTVSLLLWEYHQQNNNFRDVLNIYVENFKSRPVGSRNYEKAQDALLLIETNNIINYIDLAVLIIAVDAGPRNQFFVEVWNHSAKSISDQLCKVGFEMKHLIGSSLSNED